MKLPIEIPGLNNRYEPESKIEILKNKILSILKNIDIKHFKLIDNSSIRFVSVLSIPKDNNENLDKLVFSHYMNTGEIYIHFNNVEQFLDDKEFKEKISHIIKQKYSNLKISLEQKTLEDILCLLEKIK